MLKITLAAAEEILSPYVDDLGNSIKNALDDYIDQDTKQKAIHSKRTRASNISDWIGYHIEKDFDGRQGVHFYRSYGQVRLVIEDKILLVFKKLDKNGRASYIRTDRAKSFFEGQVGQLKFPNIQLKLPNVLTPREKLIAGYEWKELLPADIYIVCPNVPVTEWRLEAVPDQVPARADVDTPVAPTKKVKPRVRMTQKQNKQDS